MNANDRGGPGFGDDVGRMKLEAHLLLSVDTAESKGQRGISLVVARELMAPDTPAVRNDRNEFAVERGERADVQSPFLHNGVGGINLGDDPESEGRRAGTGCGCSRWSKRQCGLGFAARHQRQERRVNRRPPRCVAKDLEMKSIDNGARVSHRHRSGDGCAGFDLELLGRQDSAYAHLSYLSRLSCHDEWVVPRSVIRSAITSDPFVARPIPRV